MGDDHDVALATRRPAPQRALLGKRGAQPASGSTRSLRTGCLGRPNRYVASRLGGRKLGWRPPAPLTTGGHRSGEVPAGGYHHGSSSILVNWPWRLPLAVGVRPTAACSAPRTRHGAASARGIAPIRDRHHLARYPLKAAKDGLDLLPDLLALRGRMHAGRRDSAAILSGRRGSR